MLGLGSSIAGLVSSFGPSITRRDEVALTFHRCLERAVNRGVEIQGLGTDVATVVLRHVTPTIAEQSLLGNIEMLAAPDRADVWKAALEKLLRGNDGIDPDQLDVPRLASETASNLVEEVRNEATIRSSPLFPAFVLSKLSEQGPAPTPDAVPGAPVTNFAELALGAEPVARPEQDLVEQSLSERAMVVLFGGPGLGKSMIARMTVERRLRSDDVGLVWWITASTPGRLVESCESLLTRLGMRPGDNPCGQVRELLAARDDWFLIIDDAPDLDTVGKVVPNGLSPGKVLVTTRSAASFAPRTLVRLDTADSSTLRAIARANLQGEVSDDDLDDLITSCGSNPLALVAACRFAVAIGRSVRTLPDLLSSDPARVLDTPVDASYPDTFVGVVRKAQTAATEQHAFSWGLMTALAIAGGDAVPRDIVEAAFLIDSDQSEVDDALRVLNALGLIDFGHTTVRCHALVAALVVELGDEALRERSASGLLAAVRAVAVLSDDSQTVLSLGSILDAAEKYVPTTDRSRTLARLQLAERLGALGLVQTAARHISIAESSAAEAAPVDRALLVIARARLHLATGEPSQARELVREIAADTNLPASIVAAACTTLAWAEQGVGDRAAAASVATFAAELAPDDPDVQSLAEHFAIQDVPPNEKVRRYLALDAQARARGRRPGGPGGLYLGMASRACIEARRLNEAISYAEQALRIDQDIDGAQSQNVARDLNDLGMAFLAAGRFDDAEAALREAITQYEKEAREHPMSAIPMLHLGRILVERGHRSVSSREELLAEARTVLRTAIEIQRKKGPGAAEMASMLYALGDTELARDLAAAAEAYEEARRIDEAVYGPLHREVGLDVVRLMQVYIALGRSEQALTLLRTLRPRIPDWELEDPELAFGLLSWQMLALLEQPQLGPLQTAELRGIAHRVRGLLHVDTNSAHAQVVRKALDQADRLHR